jgi:DNA replication and repair protein RecF
MRVAASRPTPESQSAGAGRQSFLADESVRSDDLADAFREALVRSAREEAARGMTVVGPHRDDLRFTIGSANARTYGSRGQQRSAALATKLAEAQWIERLLGEEPVVLLDDVLSELDPARRAYLLERVAGCEQALLTTTDPDALERGFAQQATAVEVAAGEVILREGSP